MRCPNVNVDPTGFIKNMWEPAYSGVAPVFVFLLLLSWCFLSLLSFVVLWWPWFCWWISCLFTPPRINNRKTYFCRNLLLCIQMLEIGCWIIDFSFPAAHWEAGMRWVQRRLTQIPTMFSYLTWDLRNFPGWNQSKEVSMIRQTKPSWAGHPKDGVSFAPHVWYSLWCPNGLTFLHSTGGILTFYFIFFSVLAAIFAICMYAMMSTLSPDYPRWQLSESIIGTNPGLGFRPYSGDVEKHGSLIWYVAANESNVMHWTGVLDQFLEGLSWS